MTVFFGDGTSQTSAAGASKLVQTKQTSSSTSYSFSSSSYSDTNLSESITPTSSSNRILVRCALCTRAYATNSTSLGIRLLRGSTNIYTNNEYHWHAVNAAINLFYQSYFEFLDSPNTTSAVTYKIQGARYRTSNGTQIATFNPVSGQTSYMILQEITL